MRVISGSARGTTLHSIENINTRPTLDRVKESLFNIIANYIDEDTVILDLFAGSGAIAIEALSRGAKKAFLCDISAEAIHMIKQNLFKTKLEQRAIVKNNKYDKCLEELANENIKFDLIYIDPPYKENLAVSSVKKIQELNLLNDNGIIIVETDEEKREIDELNKNNIKYKIFDLRKYGRAHLIFLDERGKEK